MGLSDDRPFTPKSDRTSLLTSSPPCLIAYKKAVEVRSHHRSVSHYSASPQQIRYTEIRPERFWTHPNYAKDTLGDRSPRQN